MKKILVVLAVSCTLLASACEKNNPLSDTSGDIPSNLPRTNVPSELQGNWMYGNFSMTEYWSQNPSDYLGNALEFAIAFQFYSNGTYTQYFTSSSVIGGIRTYQQSVTKGTVEIDGSGKIIKTHPYTAHYKRTRNGQTVEERDLTQSELSSATTYSYSTAVEPNGSKALFLKLQGTTNALAFIKKQ